MKASNIYQTLKSRAKASTTAKPQLPGIGSPLNLKAKNPIDPPKKTKDNKYHLDKSPRNPYHFQKPTEKMVRTTKPLAKKTPQKEKLPMAKAAPAKLKKDTPKTKTPNEKKYAKYGYKEKIVKAESSSYDATKGELTKTFSDADVKKYGIKKTSTTKAKIKSPAKKKSCGSPVKMDVGTKAEMPSEATGGPNPKRAMRKAKRRGNRGGREAMKKFRKCKRSRYGRGKAN